MENSHTPSSLVYNTKLEDSTGLEITGKVMVSVMVILFFIILLFLFLHLYLKTCFTHRPYHQDQQTLTAGRRRRHEFAAARHHASTRCRLDPAVLNSIPVIIFSAKDSEMECAVCLSETVEGEKVRILPKCSHGFHVDCIDMWFQSNSTCPICRNLVSSQETKLKVEAEDSAVFPTNVLVWGNQGDVTSSSSNSAETSSSSSSSSSSPSNIKLDEIVIEMPRQINEDKETSSPIMKQLKSFKRLLSMGGTSRVNPSSSSDSGKKGPEQC